MFYPNLDLNQISDINISVEKKFIENEYEPSFDLQSVEFKFPYANNLIAQGFQKLEGTNDTYRAIVTSPWVFKKLMVEVKTFQFVQDQNIEISVIVVENSSNINNITQAEGSRLFGGNAKLVDTSPEKTVDILNTSYLGKALTLRLYSKTISDTAQIQAVWMGHGTKTLTLFAPTQPNMKPVALLSETVGDDQHIRVRLTNGTHTIESPDESLRVLLEQQFGPLN
jgi:hypothetical protein